MEQIMFDADPNASGTRASVFGGIPKKNEKLRDENTVFYSHTFQFGIGVEYEEPNGAKAVFYRSSFDDATGVADWLDDERWIRLTDEEAKKDEFFKEMVVWVEKGNEGVRLVAKRRVPEVGVIAPNLKIYRRHYRAYSCYRTDFGFEPWENRSGEKVFDVEKDRFGDYKIKKEVTTTTTTTTARNGSATLTLLFAVLMTFVSL